jgi:phosphate-selective porin OprO/OprP
MPTRSRKYSRWLLALAVSWAWLALAAPGRADDPAQAAKVAELERRVRELEDIIRRMQPPPGSPNSTQPAQLPPVEGAQPPAGETPSDSALPPPGAGQEAGGQGGGGGAPSIPSTPTPAGGGATAGGGGGAGGGGAFAGWNNGFYLRSQDRNFVLRLTGQLQADYRSFEGDGDVTDIGTFLIRRARLGIEAEVFKYFEFRLLPDFGSQVSPIIQDAYMNVHYVDWLQFTAGKFKQPFSYEQLIQDRYTPLMERSLIDQLVPQRDEGVMLHGENLLGKRLDYAVSVYNGEINNNPATDTNDHKDLAGRIALRPFNTEGAWPLLRGLQLGIAGTTGIEQEPVSPSTLRTPLTVPFFTFNSTVRADGLRNRWSPEIVYFYGPLGLAAQYFHQDQELRPAFFGTAARFRENVPFEGGYVMGTYLLTGEERTGYTQLFPRHPFDPWHPCASPGAWELSARASRLELGADVFAPGALQLANPALFSRGVTEMTLGFNWYLNAWVRWQFNWEHDWFDQPVRLGPGPRGEFNTYNAWAARFQVIF